MVLSIVSSEPSLSFSLSLDTVGDHRQRVVRRPHGVLDCRKHVLRQGEEHGDRMDLVHRHDPRRIVGVHQIALVDQAEPDPPLRRGDDFGEIQVQLGCGDRGIVRLGRGPPVLCETEACWVSTLWRDANSLLARSE